MAVMAIQGVGTDITSINRVAKILQGSSGERFLQRVLTKREQEAARSRGGRLAEYAAGRFAAKEAVAKAFGCGIGAALGFHDMEIAADAAGRPNCTLSTESKAKLGMPENTRIHVSITHDGDMAAAFAVVECL